MWGAGTVLSLPITHQSLPAGVTETYLWLLAGALQSWHILCSFAIQISALNPGAPAEAAQQMDRLRGEVLD